MENNNRNSVLLLLLLLVSISTVHAQLFGGSLKTQKRSFVCGDEINFTNSGSSVSYGTIQSQTGKCWLDRNLGATRVATSFNDAASVGDLYQWGRLADGHQIKTSTRKESQSSTNVPGHGDFITLSNIQYQQGNQDWRSSTNNDLWQGVNGINNPCPTGYRLPTAAEFEAERVRFPTNDHIGAFNSLKLPATSFRQYNGNYIIYNSTIGHYWTSTTVINPYPYQSTSPTSLANTLYFDSGSSIISYAPKVHGHPVRCINAGDPSSYLPPVNISSISCNTASTGTMKVGTPVSGVTQTITATITTAGSYNISASSNGVTFAAEGIFTETGSKNIVLTATGTPTSEFSNNFTFNTTPNCSFNRVVISLSSNGTAVVSGYTCNSGSTGSLTKGIGVSGVTQTITATVATVGTYDISATANGVTFTGTGTFAGTGAQNIVLTASGTPLNSGPATYTLNTTPNCSFSRVAQDISPAAINNISCNSGSTGNMIVGTEVVDVTQTINVNFSTTGTFNISAFANGVTFAASGIIYYTGNYTITLNAYGTPTQGGSTNFTLNTSPNCSFTRSVNNHPSSNGSAVINYYDCNNNNPSMMTGVMVIGVPVSGVTQTITANVTRVGTYNIIAQYEGVTWSASGTFYSTGSQNVVLTATGTPTQLGSHPRILQTSPSCEFYRTVDCGTYIAQGVLKAFMCKNLGPLDPNLFSQYYDLNQNTTGNYYAYGRNYPMANSYSGAGPVNVQGPANYGSWSSGPKNGNDPCPLGFKLPTGQDWYNVLQNNNNYIRVGSWNNSSSNFSSGAYLGPAANPAALTLPAAGSYDYFGYLQERGSTGRYWTSDNFVLKFDSSSIGVDVNGAYGNSVRCVRE
jgi:uncharacterized protein (TIGR02145 family)